MVYCSIARYHHQKKTPPISSAAAYAMVLKVLDWFNLHYLGFIIIVVGVLGNAKNVVGFMRSCNKLRSPSYYLAALALADAVFLDILFILWLSHFEDFDLFSLPGVYETFFFLSSL